MFYSCCRIRDVFGCDGTYHIRVSWGNVIGNVENYLANTCEKFRIFSIFCRDDVTRMVFTFEKYNIFILSHQSLVKIADNNETVFGINQNHCTSQQNKNINFSNPSKYNVCIR